MVGGGVGGGGWTIIRWSRKYSPGATSTSAAAAVTAASRERAARPPVEVDAIASTSAGLMGRSTAWTSARAISKSTWRSGRDAAPSSGGEEVPPTTPAARRNTRRQEGGGR